MRIPAGLSPSSVSTFAWTILRTRSSMQPSVCCSTTPANFRPFATLGAPEGSGKNRTAASPTSPLNPFDERATMGSYPLIAAAKSQAKPRKSFPRPTHFVSLRIDNVEIHRAVGAMQEEILCTEGGSSLKPCRIDVRKLHLTLGVLNLEGEAQVTAAKAMLREVVHESAAMRRGLASSAKGVELAAEGEGVPLQLLFDGLGHFRKDVLFIKPREDTHLDAVRHMARLMWDKASVLQLTHGEEYKFEAHATIFKTSKVKRGKGQGPPVRIERHHFEQLLDTPLGTQVFTGLELLQMRIDKETGYYVQEHHVPFAP